MPTTAVPSILSKTGTLSNAALRKRWAFEDNFSTKPLLEAAADLNGTFDDEEVEAVAAGNLAWTTAGTNATAPAFSTGGGITLTTGTTSGDDTYISAHGATGGNAVLNTVDFSTSDGLALYVQIKTPASIDNLSIGAGLKLTWALDGTDANQVYFRYQDTQSGGDWELRTSIAGTDDTIDTGIAVAASTTYELVLEVSESDRTVQGWIATDYGDFTAVGQTSALTADIDLLPFVGVETNEAGANSVTVRKVAISKVMND